MAKAKKKQKQDKSYVEAAQEAFLENAQAAIDSRPDVDLTNQVITVVHVPAVGGFYIAHIAPGTRTVVGAAFVRYEHVHFIAVTFSEFLKQIHIAVEAARKAEAGDEVVGDVIEAQEAGVLHQVELPTEAEDGETDD